MKLKLFGLALLFSVLSMSCKDELSEDINKQMKSNEIKVEKAGELKPATQSSHERRDRDWEKNVGS